MAGGLTFRDRDWVKKAFFLNSDLDTNDLAGRYFNSAMMKFTDTTLGGNLCINPPPQFTRTADIRETSRYSKSKGMGAYYSEMIDDNNQIINIRFGVPQFNSMSTFFTGFYNAGAATMVKTGRGDWQIMYNLGRAVGFVVAINCIPLLCLNMASTVWRFMMGNPVSKYYYLKPTMPLYWNAVQSIVNQLAVNDGIIPKVFSDEVLDKLGAGYGTSKAEFAALHKFLPDVFRESGGIDVYSVANRAQRLANKQCELMAAHNWDGEGTLSSISNAIKAIYTGNLSDIMPTHETYMRSWADSVLGTTTASAAPVQTTNPDGSTNTSDTPVASTPNEIINSNESPGTIDKIYDFFKAELYDGSAFASFRVDYTGAVHETFATTTMESEISNKINSMSSSSRNTNFSFAGGNVIPGMDTILGAAKDVLGGIGDTLNISGIAAMAGSAFADIPKHVDNSSAQMNNASYTIKLSTPYNNPISRLMYIYVPLAMLLAGALPRSTGAQSYTSPFICEWFDQGRCQSRLGVIDSLSISRGTTNLGWNQEGKALGLEIQFTIQPLSGIVHMPINQGFSLNPFRAIFSEDTEFSDYLATLAGMGLADQIYVSRKFKLNVTKAFKNWDSYFSATHFMSFMGDTLPMRIASAFVKGTAK